MALIYKENFTLPRTNLVAEYRFEEGSGSILYDSSGNQYNGTYVGSPTFVRNGGFIAGSNSSGATQYAVGHPNFLLSGQTFYFVASCNLTTGVYHALMGNSSGYTNLNIQLSDPTNNAQFISANVNGGTGPGNGGNAVSYDTIPLTPFLVAVTIDGSNTAVPRIYIEGREVGAYYSRALNSSLGRVGTPWFGGTNSGSTYGGYAGNIYFAASYSDLHTAEQILNNSKLIRNYLSLRGTEDPRVFAPTGQTSQLLALGSSTTAGLQSSPYLSLLQTRITFDKWVRGMSGGVNEISYAAPGLASFHFAPNAAFNIACLQFGGNVTTSRNLYRAVFESLTSAAKVFKQKGWRVLVQTVIDRGDSTGLTVPSYFDAINNLIRSNFTPDELVDIAADPRFGTIGASSDTTYYNADKIHLNSTGQQILADMYSSKINRITNYGGSSKVLYTQNTGVTITSTSAETTCVGFTPNGGAEWNNISIICNTTSGSTTLATSQGSPFCVVGQLATGTNIPPNSTISSISYGTSITLTNAVTATTSNLKTTISKIGVKKHFFDIGQSIYIEQRGLISTDVSQTLNKKIKFGSTVLGQTGAVTLTSSLSSAPYVLKLKVTPLTLGTSANFIVEGELAVYDSATSTNKIYPINSGNIVLVNTTADAILDITDTWGSSSSSNIDVVTSLNIFRD